MPRPAPRPAPAAPPAPAPAPPAATGAPEPGAPVDDAPSWVDAEPPTAASPVEHGFVFEHSRHLYRVTRGERTLFTLGALGVARGWIAGVVPLGDGALAWVNDGEADRYVAVRWSPGAPPRTLATSREPAFAATGAGFVVAQGHRVELHPFDGGRPRVLRRFAPGARIVRAHAAGDAVLVMVGRGAEARTGDVYRIGRAAPLARDVEWVETRARGWVVQGREGTRVVEVDGAVRDGAPGAPIERCAQEVCVRAVRASAVVQVDALGRARRLSPWTTDREAVAGAPVSRDGLPDAQDRHRLDALRSARDDALVFRADRARPWYRLDGGLRRGVEATPCATAAAVEGARTVVEERGRLRVFDADDRPGRALDLGAPASEWALDGPFVHHVTRSGSRSTRVTTPLDGSAPPTQRHRVVHPDGPHTLELDALELVLDGRRRAFPEEDRAPRVSVRRVDGVYAVREAPYALVVTGRESFHGGHFEFERVLAVDLARGAVRPVGPVGAFPSGARSHERYGILRSLDTSADGRHLLMRARASVLLAPLDGGAARVVYRGADPAPGLSSSVDRARFAILDRGRLLVGRHDTGEVAAVGPARAARRVAWAPGGHALAAVDAAGVVAVGDDGVARRAGCAGGDVELVDVLPGGGAALVRVGPRWRVAAPGACHPLGAMGAPHESQPVPRGTRALSASPACPR